LDQNFSVSEPKQAWVSDITFIRCKYGWLYLCVIIDLFSREVVGLALSKVNDSELILKTLQRAVVLRLTISNNKNSNPFYPI